MKVPLEFWRGVLALLGLFFAYVLGRSYIACRAGRVRLSRVYSWVIRTTLCVIAIAWRRPFDWVVVVAYLLIAAACAAGVWAESRPRKDEDLTDQIFHKE